MVKGLTAFASATTLLVCSNDAFTISTKTFSNRVSNTVGKSTPLYMASEDNKGDEKVVLETVNEKNIYYDDKLGRFFESTQEDCEPEDEYCVIDDKTGEAVKLTLEEKERIFMDALQSYYVSGKQVLSDDDFDLLKADLQWNGSDKANVNRKEAKYISAMQAYLKGEPLISDEEFDTLKRELKEDGSIFAVSTEPQCYIDTGICKVTWKNDFFRTNLLYFPLGLILSLGWLGISFEILEPFLRLNPLVLLLIGAFPIYTVTKTITDEFIFINPKISYGPCPSCEAENRVYFGDILGVEGFGDVAEFKCSKCKTVSRVQRQSLRVSTLPK